MRRVLRCLLEVAGAWVALWRYRRLWNETQRLFAGTGLDPAEVLTQAAMATGVAPPRSPISSMRRAVRAYHAALHDAAMWGVKPWELESVKRMVF